MALVGTTTTACLLTSLVVGAAGFQLRGSEDDLPWKLTKRGIQEVAVRGNDCTCENWKWVYGFSKHECGTGLELYSYTKGANDTATKDKVSERRGGPMCNAFYKRLDNNFCMNIGQTNAEGEFADKQWCYVDSKKCGRLNGGEHLKGSQYSWKICGENDAQTRDRSVEELMHISRVSDVDIAVLLRMAYPVHQYWAWWYAQQFFGLTAGRPMKALAVKQAETDMDPQLRSDMQGIQSSSRPMVFLNQEEGEKPFGIVHKGRIYEVMDNKDNAMIKHPRSWSKLLCVKGCEDSTVVKTNSAAAAAVSGQAAPQQLSQNPFGPPMFTR